MERVKEVLGITELKSCHLIWPLHIELLKIFFPTDALHNIPQHVFLPHGVNSNLIKYSSPVTLPDTWFWYQYIPSCDKRAILTCSHHVADRGQLTERGIVGQDGLHGHFVGGATDVRLLAEVAETGHGHEHGLRVGTPQEHVEAHLQLRLRLTADGNTAADGGTLLQRMRCKQMLATCRFTLRQGHSFSNKWFTAFMQNLKEKKRWKVKRWKPWEKKLESS